MDNFVLTSEIVLSAYKALLLAKPGMCLVIDPTAAVFLECGEVQITALANGVPVMCDAGALTDDAWDDEKECWCGDDNRAYTLGFIGNPMFIINPEYKASI